VADFVTKNQRLGWRGSFDDTVQQMSDAEAAAAVAAMRALYVEVLRLAPPRLRVSE
jgi:hypothetical protein